MFKSENYCITRENLACHEIIGLDARVVESTDKTREGIFGKVIDETKNVFVLECSGGKIRKIPKMGAVFEFMVGEEKAVIAGKTLAMRPQDRTRITGGKIYGAV